MDSKNMKELNLDELQNVSGGKTLSQPYRCSFCGFQTRDVNEMYKHPLTCKKRPKQSAPLQKQNP